MIADVQASVIPASLPPGVWSTTPLIVVVAVSSDPATADAASIGSRGRSIDNCGCFRRLGMNVAFFHVSSSGLTCLNIGAAKPIDNWGTTLDFWLCDLKVSTALEPLDQAARGPLSQPPVEGRPYAG